MLRRLALVSAAVSCCCVLAAFANSGEERALTSQETWTVFGGDITEDAACLLVMECTGETTDCVDRNSMMECISSPDETEYDGNQDECVEGYGGCTCDFGDDSLCHATYSCVWSAQFNECRFNSVISSVWAPDHCDSCF